MVHDTIPFANVKSYTKFPQLPAMRFPGFEKPEHNDIMVFNWPADTLYQFFDRSNRRADKPMDKRSNYVKRTVGLPGDDWEIKDEVFDLGDRAQIQYAYNVRATGAPLEMNFLIKDHNLADPLYQLSTDISYIQSLRFDAAERLSQLSSIKEVKRDVKIDAEFHPVKKSFLAIFPHTKPWSGDNLGPIHIPAKGEVVELNSETLPFYEAIIKDYEHNTLEVKDDGTIYVNNQPVTTYTIQQDYYYMMG